MKKLAKYLIIIFIILFPVLLIYFLEPWIPSEYRDPLYCDDIVGCRNCNGNCVNEYHSSDVWLMLDSRTCKCDLTKNKCMFTNSGPGINPNLIIEGGTPLSIETTEFEIMPSTIGILEPSEPLVGILEIKNKGGYNASNIEVKLWSTWKDSETYSEIKTGNITNVYCSGKNNFSSYEDIATCYWKNITYPSEFIFSNFLIKENSWNLTGGDNLNRCVDENKNIVKCENKSNVFYEHGGQIVSFNANITYDYDVNAINDFSMPIVIVDQEKYADLIQSGILKVQEIQSKYRVGPAVITLFSQRQPIREVEKSLFVASVTNDGSGVLNKVYIFNILIQKEIIEANNDVEIVSKTFDSCEKSSEKNYVKISCNSSKSLKSGDYKRVAFYITPKNITDDSKRFLISASLNYEYIKTISQTLTIANNPNR